MNALQEKSGRLQELRKQWGDLHAPHAEKMDHTAEVVDKMQQLNTEMADLGKEVERLKGIADQAAEIKSAQDQYNTPVDNVGHGPTNGRPQAEGKSLGEMFTDSPSYKRFAADTRVQGTVAAVDAPYTNFKATFTTTASSLTMRGQQPGLVMVENQRLTVADLLSSGRTNENVITYFQEDTYTNAATAVLEEGAKPEATFDTSEATAPVRKIAVVARVTDEFFQDFPAMQSYINGRMVFMVEEKEEYYLLNGTGTAPQIKGILQYATIQTQAKGADPVPDAVYKAMTKVRYTGFYEPDAAVFHPNDWQDVRLLRTTDGIYIWGNPSEDAPERIWGLKVVVTTAMTENTALVGAFKLGGQVFRREGIRIETTNSDASDFQYNRIAIRAEERLALAVWRPKAFCTVTGI